MAKVVYRGAAYDTNDRLNKMVCTKETFVETYRGVKHTEKVEVVS